MTIILDPQLPIASQITIPNSIYVISDVMDLHNAVLSDLPLNCTFRFVGGLIKNGVIYGNNTRIDNPFNSVILDNVELCTDVEYDDEDHPKPFLNPVTGWLGECRDTWFHYNESSYAHFALVKSVCQFERCIFSSRTYYIEKWETILLRPYGCVIKGGGAVFILTGNKGIPSPTGWNGLDEYLPTCLFYKHSPNRYGAEYISGKKSGRFFVSDLTILDNNTLDDVPQGWGENFVGDINRNIFVFYAIFKGAGNQTVFHNVKYDGRGGLWAHYNYEVAIKEISFINCDIKTSQFAMELGNVHRTELSDRYPDGGSCNIFRISHCRIYNYAANVLVGPLSVVNQDDHVQSSITQSIYIEHSTFDSEHVKNLELSGGRSVYIRDCEFRSVFCSRGLDKYVDSQLIEHPINERFYIIGNVFGISEHFCGQLVDQDVRSIDGGNIVFTNNVIMADFGTQGKPKGSFLIRGYGNNLAFVSGNTFIIKNTNNEYFKSLLFYQDTVLDLTGNTYCFTEGVRQGYEVSIGGRGGFIHLETEDDPRFSNVAGGGFSDWIAIPVQQRTPEGCLQKNLTLPLSNSFMGDPAYSPQSVPLKAFEFDLNVHLDGQGKYGEHTFLKFHAGSYMDGNDYYERYVLVQTYNGVFRICIALDDGADTEYYYFNSDSGVQVALPSLGLDACGNDYGILRVVFINELVAGDVTKTRVVLYLKDNQVDTFLLDHDILTEGIEEIRICGSPYVRIKNYRLRTQVKTLPNPVVADRLTKNPNIGYARSGDTASRPVYPEVGFCYFDTDEGRPIFYNGSIWIDADEHNI